MNISWGFFLAQCVKHSVEISWFYVKSIFGILAVQNLVILKHLEALNFDFYELFALFEGWKPNEQNSEPQNCKIKQFKTSRLSKADFT